MSTLPTLQKPAKKSVFATSFLVSFFFLFPKARKLDSSFGGYNIIHLLDDWHDHFILMFDELQHQTLGSTLREARATIRGS